MGVVFVRCTVLVAIAAASACTRTNPAFGESAAETSSPGSTSTPSANDDTSGDTSIATSSDPSTPPLDTTATTDDPSVTDSGDPSASTDGSTGTNACEFHGRRFDLGVTGERGEVAQPCGAVSVFTGPVFSDGALGQLIVRDCGGGCMCADGPEYIIEFKQLDPSPIDAIDDGPNACVTLSWFRQAEDDGCSVEWLSMETVVTPADRPRFMASNFAQATWGHFVPVATLGPSLDTCDEADCSEPSTGHYTLAFGAAQALAPGETTPMVLDPYANTLDVTYDVHALFAQVDHGCTVDLGWAAIEAD